MEFLYLLFLFQHINDLCGKIDLSAMINKAEGIYYQIIEADHLTNEVRLILGLPIASTNHSLDNSDISPLDTSNDSNGQQPCSLETISIGPDAEIHYERSINHSFL